MHVLVLSFYRQLFASLVLIIIAAAVESMWLMFRSVALHTIEFKSLIIA
jgi:hypothetical protein